MAVSRTGSSQAVHALSFRESAGVYAGVRIQLAREPVSDFMGCKAVLSTAEQRSAIA